MSTGDPKGPFLYDLPAVELWEFCRIMDALSDLDWTRFGESEPELRRLRGSRGAWRRWQCTCLSVFLCLTVFCFTITE